MKHCLSGANKFFQVTVFSLFLQNGETYFHMKRLQNGIKETRPLSHVLWLQCRLTAFASSLEASLSAVLADPARLVLRQSPLQCLPKCAQ